MWLLLIILVIAFILAVDIRVDDCPVEAACLHPTMMTMTGTTIARTITVHTITANTVTSSPKQQKLDR